MQSPIPVGGKNLQVGQSNSALSIPPINQRSIALERDMATSFAENGRQYEADDQLWL
jgi:hypothetical protein